MVKCKKIAIIGHFGGSETILDGQTVKTKILYDELLKKTGWDILKVDTYFKHKQPLKLIMHTIYALLTTKDIIIITSQNGRRIYFPILFFFAKTFHTRVYHDVIGAKLAEFVMKYPSFKKYLNSFYVNWVETDCLKRKLEEVGVNNAELLPNFKQLEIVAKFNNGTPKDEPYKLCTFSRVMQEKGIEDAVDAVVKVNTQLERTVFTLDIYGPVDQEQGNWFKVLQSKFPEYINYRGIVHYQKSVTVLNQYFALLFPTRFFTEGVPGTIVDAYAAGIPVIASKWESFSDVIEEGITGIGYAFKKTEELVNILLEIAEKPDIITSLSENCIKKAEYYQPEKSVELIIDTITTAT